ncbi:MAG: hypothetical protein Q4G59_08995, partial [Planctomycetia bacterium]|nr:hypothetical protein [Planctomycetia bacterium]
QLCQLYEQSDKNHLEAIIHSLKKKEWCISCDSKGYSFDDESFVRYMVEEGIYKKYFLALQSAAIKLACDRSLSQESEEARQFERARNLFAEACVNHRKVGRVELVYIVPYSSWNKVAYKLIFCENVPWFQFLADDLFKSIVVVMLSDSIKNLRTVPDHILDFFVSSLEKFAPEATVLLYEYLWLTNDPRISLESFPESMHKIYTALFEGHYAEAYGTMFFLPREWFYYSKRTSSPVVLPGIMGIFFVLCQFAAGRVQSASDVCEWMNASFMARTIPDTLKEEWQVLSKLADSWSLSRKPFIDDSSHSWMISLLLSFAETQKPMWKDGSSDWNPTETEKQQLKSYPQIEKLLNSLKSDTIPNANSIAVPTVNDVHNRLVTEQYSTSFRSPQYVFYNDTHKGQVTRQSTPQKLEDWEEALSKLNATLGIEDRSEQPKEQDERLVWILHYDSDSLLLSMTPKRQVYSQRSGWKSVNGTNSQEALEAIPSLTAQDLGILKNPCRGEKAFLELVGHPRVFLDSQTNTPVELVVEPPSLTFEDRKDGTLVYPSFVKYMSQDQQDIPQETFSTRLDQTEDRFCLAIHESDVNPFRIISVGDLKGIFKIFGTKGKLFPPTAIPQLEQMLAKLPQLVCSHVDEQIEPDRTPRDPYETRLTLRLLAQEKEGYKLQMLVYPFGRSAPPMLPCSGEKTPVAIVLGRTLRTKRDFQRERELVKQVLAACPSLEFATQVRIYEYNLDSLEQTLQFLYEFRVAQLECVDLIQPKNALQVSTAEIDKCRLVMKSAKEWLEITGTIEIDE